MEKVFVSNMPTIGIKWTIFKGGSTREDLAQAEVAVWLVKRDNKIPLAVEIDEQKRLCMVLPESLEAGVYGLKVVWIKDRFHPGGLMAIPKKGGSQVDNVLMVKTDDDGDCRTADFTMGVQSEVNTSYGYDGLDAYELSYMSGKTTLDYQAWLDWINQGGGSGVQYSIIEGTWALTLRFPDGTEVDPDGADVAYEAILSKTDYKVGTDGSKVPLIRSKAAMVSAEVEGGSLLSTDVVVYDNYIKVSKNMRADRRIVVTATDGGSLVERGYLTQRKGAEVEMVTAVDADGMDVLDETREAQIVCHDTEVLVSLEKVGDVGLMTCEVEGEWLEAEMDQGDVRIGVDPNGTEEVRSGKVRVMYAGGKVYVINVEQTYLVDTEVRVPTASVTYPVVAANLSNKDYIKPVINFSQVIVEVRSNEAEILHTSRRITRKEWSDSANMLVPGGDGQIMPTEKRYVPAAGVIDHVAVDLYGEKDGGTDMKVHLVVDVTQAGAEVRPMAGRLKASISNFASYAQSKISNITTGMVQNAIDGGDIVEAGDLATLAQAMEVETQAGDYVIGLVPVAIQDDYRWRVIDQFSQQGDTFEADEGYYANGGVTIEANNIQYLVYGQYSAGDIPWKLINK